MEPLVSVVMPVRNGGKWLQAAADSILAQSHDSLELIVVDDHSEDDALARLDRSDTRLCLHKSRGQGVSAAFNTGMGLARGDFIARMDADDLALPNRIRDQLDYLARHTDVDLCGGKVELFSAAGLAGGNQRYQAWLNGCATPDHIARELFVESPIPNPTAFFRREALLRLGGYRDPDWPEDYDLFLRADALGMKMGKPSAVLLRWREHDTRLTRTDKRYALERFQAAKIHYLVQYRLPTDCEPLVWGAGPTGRLTCDLLRAEGRDVAGFIEVHPRRIGGLKRDRPVRPVEYLQTDHDSFVIVAVGAAGAREEIRSFMGGVGRIEGEHYLFVA